MTSAGAPRPAVRVFDASPIRSRLDAILRDPSIPPKEQVERMNAATFHTPVPLARQTGDAPTGDAVVDRAFDNATTVDTFLRTTLARDGWDGHGGSLDVKVRFPSDNASWEYRDDTYWVGDRGAGASLGNALDVTAHEVAHGIFRSEVYPTRDAALTSTPDVWQRAVDESFADVFAAQVDPDDWTMGEDVGDPALVRDMAHPRFATVADVPLDRLVDPNGSAATRIGRAPTEQPIGEHDLSGIPSLAAVRVADRIGRGTMGRIWYRALTDHLRADDRFEGAARATTEAAADLFGSGSREVAAVRDAWRSVGVIDARATRSGRSWSR